MSDPETTSRLQAAASEAAAAFDCELQVAQNDDEWIASIEPSVDTDRHGTFSIVGSGPTEAMALSDLIKQARKHGL